MARNIEEFLRRAAERRQKQQKRGPAPSQRVRDIVETDDIEVVQPIEVVKPAAKKKTFRRNLDRHSQQRQQRDMRHETVSQHVESHINTSDISSHAEHLGDRIQNADDRIAARLHKKFDHDVSKLDDLPTVQDDIVATVTAADISHISKSIIKMLKNPASVRQAILIAEILKRPDFD